MQTKHLIAFIGCMASIIAPVAASPVDKRQAYDGWFGPITEMVYCSNPFNIAACLAAHGHATVATYAARDLFDLDTLHNGEGDAYRHCYWNARMAIDIGVTKAKTIGDNHEVGSENPPNEKAMDLANNETGRAIGVAAAGATKEAKYNSADAECYLRANTGLLVTLP